MKNSSIEAAKKGFIKSMEDAWSVTKAKAEELAAEQAKADIALVEAQRALNAAQKVLLQAQARKTTAERKLATFRASLGGE